jgi:transcriptional regulator
VPKLNAVEDKLEIATMIADTGMANLVTHCNETGLASSMIPFLADAGLNKLRGHLARANPHAVQLLARCAENSNGVEAMLLFSPTDGYISPAWYPSKSTNGGKVLPTWNYELVQVHGRVRIVEDETFIQEVIGSLSDLYEAKRVMFEKEAQGSAKPAWAVGDAPEKYIKTMTNAIVGIEVQITAITAKKKLSQNRPLKDAEAVTQALLQGEGGCGGRGLGHRMARL